MAEETNYEKFDKDGSGKLDFNELPKKDRKGVIILSVILAIIVIYFIATFFM